MNILDQISEPLLLNPLKHHLGFIRDFIEYYSEDKFNAETIPTTELKHLGKSVMDVYYGNLSVLKICSEIENCLEQKDLLKRENFLSWTGLNRNSFRIMSLSDGSEWTLKFHDNIQRYVHIFPARNSRYTFRVKANTLKSAILYYIVIGKDLITGKDLNKARTILGLSPVKDPVDTEAITEMIEILRG